MEILGQQTTASQSVSLGTSQTNQSPKSQSTLPGESRHPISADHLLFPGDHIFSIGGSKPSDFDSTQAAWVRPNSSSSYSWYLQLWRRLSPWRNNTIPWPNRRWCGSTTPKPTLTIVQSYCNLFSKVYHRDNHPRDFPLQQGSYVPPHLHATCPSLRSSWFASTKACHTILIQYM